MSISGHIINSTESEPKRWHVTPFLPAGVVGLLLLLAGLFFEVGHGSYAAISIANLPIKADASTTQLTDQIKAQAAAYRLAVQYPDKSIKRYPLSAAGISVDAAQTAANAKSQLNSSFVRRLEWWRPLTLPLYTKTNEHVMDQFVANSATVVKVAPLDAQLSIANGLAVVSPEASGQGSRLDDPESEIIARTMGFSAQPLVLKPGVLKPSITEKNLATSKAKVQSLIDKPVAFTIAGHTVSATPTDIGNWLDLSPVPKSKTVDVSVNSGKVLDYINLVARRYISQPRSRVVANTSDGQVVLDYGANGVDVINKDQTAADIASQLAQKQSVSVDLPVKYTAAKTVEAQAYDKWFVADVTNKRMYAYEGTNLVRTFLISAGAPATPTVVGTYKIYAKYVSQDMTGDNADGSRHFQPAVPYVNYFTGGYAIHGNYWRPASYFGNINSSHGCIGITVSDAAWIYDWAPIGTVVITHT
jgi:lipoprotein-anchoring transpeptidase ErfK/SrfK